MRGLGLAVAKEGLVRGCCWYVGAASGGGGGLNRI
jgi:hypothetical protein